MRSESSATIAARTLTEIVSFDLIRIGGRNRSTGAIEYLNAWNGHYTVTIPVIDGITGEVTDYAFVNAGSLVKIDGLQYVAEQSITVRNITVSLGPISSDVIEMVRGYDLHEQEFQYWQADFDKSTRGLIDSAGSYYVGIIDNCDIPTPKAGDLATIDLTIRSAESDMTRKNTLYRTHASEVLRDTSDEFYTDVQDIPLWVVNWGSKKAPVRSL